MSTGNQLTLTEQGFQRDPGPHKVADPTASPGQDPEVEGAPARAPSLAGGQAHECCGGPGVRELCDRVCARAHVLAYTVECVRVRLERGGQF